MHFITGRKYMDRGRSPTNSLPYDRFLTPYLEAGPHSRATPHNADNARPNPGSRGDAGTAIHSSCRPSSLSIWSQNDPWLKFSLFCLARFGRPGRYDRGFYRTIHQLFHPSLFLLGIP
jgi:hypothetical protein